jgi:hypothetical protein
MDRGGFLELFGFPEGLRENAKRQAGALGVAWPDGLIDSARNRGNVLSRQRQAFDGKGIAQNQKIAAYFARIRAGRADLCVFLPHSLAIVLGCHKINMR